MSIKLWSWFLFYLYLILLSLPIIITNKSLDFIKSQLSHHNISNKSLIELICQLILTVGASNMGFVKSWIIEYIWTTWYVLDACLQF